MRQELLPGLEGFVCTFQCLTHCPFPNEPCLWDDPDIGEPIEYPPFFWWRLEYLTDWQKDQLKESGSDMMIITPDCLDQFYPEPPGNVRRCPRCLSTDIDWQTEWIICKYCGWSEPLHDYPVAQRGCSPQSIAGR